MLKKKSWDSVPLVQKEEKWAENKSNCESLWFSNNKKIEEEMVEMVLSHCADRERWEFQGPKSWNQQWDFEREREGKCVGERETAAVQQLLMEVAYFFLVVNIYWSDGFEMHLQSWNGIRGVGVQSPLRSGKHVSERVRWASDICRIWPPSTLWCTYTLLILSKGHHSLLFFFLHDYYKNFRF